MCDHISRFYSRFFPEPAVYWVFEDSILEPPIPNPDQHPVPDILPSPSETGDLCHKNIFGLSDDRAKQIFYDTCNPPEEHLVLCYGGTAQPFNWDVVSALLR